MGEKSQIEWTDATWNPVRGCSKVSEGCRNCYAMGVAARFSGKGLPYEGLAVSTPSGPQWTNKIMLVEDALTLPLRWQKPRRIFVNSMSDLFHPDVPTEYIDRVFAIMALCPKHTFQVLTKRPERMREYLTDDDLNGRLCTALGNMLDGDWIWNEGKRHRGKIDKMIDAFLGEDEDGQYLDDPMPLPNVWLGVSAEDQKTWNERVPIILLTPSAVRWVSVEPMLGAIDPCNVTDWKDAAYWWGKHIFGPDRIAWIVCGGESGNNARPMHQDWARRLRDTCESGGIPFFFKQWGEFRPIDVKADRQYLTTPVASTLDNETGVIRVGKKATGRTLDGRTWDEYPEAIHAG